MTRMLILYGTTDGHTRNIADALAHTLRDEGAQTEVMLATGDPNQARPEAYDAVLIAASVHMGKFQRGVRRWVRAHARQLNEMPTAFLCVCLAVLEDNAETRRDLDRIIQRFLDESAWRPTETQLVAGALPYTRYGWLKKLVMKRIAAKAGGDTDTTRDYVYTDWDALGEFARTFVRDLTPASHAPG